ncbi:hypothetical protein TIFTF001_028776 [Ficus carica]|uniref:Uncharacterized protein n=1 Tax=Ficus carica TaxID=3494 RepID=A0AA88DQY8_FICCA|nr:hypothetical protein TIFTF001_028776 [Ficus carica]
MESENDSETVSRTPPRSNDNMPPQLRALITPVLDTPPPTFHLKSDQMNFKCKTTTKCLLANAVEVVMKALKDYPRAFSIRLHPNPNSNVYNGPEGCHRTSAEDLSMENKFKKKKRLQRWKTFYKGSEIPSIVPDDDESDAIIGQWTIILENELSSIFWETVWYADLEGHRNFLRLYVSTEEVQREDPTEVENIRHENVRCEESRPQHDSSPMGQSRSMPCHSPLTDESMLPQASHLVDDPRVLHKLKALEEKIEKMDREVKSQYSQLKKIVTERLDKMMNIIERLVPQQSTWAGNGSRGGDRVAIEGVGFENGRDVNVMASGNEDVGIENDRGFENVRDGDVNIDNTELNVQVRDVRDNVDTEMNVLYYHSPISSNDCANEEDVSEVV